ncbi:hypothetical protein GE061_013656, partial [Apolygus lucorum]
MNSPPILTVERKWVIPDTEPVDSVVTKARGADSEDDSLKFGLESGQSLGLNMARSGPLPFKIDPRTGVVRTNQSLAGMGGTNLNIYVTVSDENYTQKTGVWVVIQDTKHPTDDSKAGRPNFDVPLQLRPPGFPLAPPPPIFQHDHFEHNATAAPAISKPFIVPSNTTRPPPSKNSTQEHPTPDHPTPDHPTPDHPTPDHPKPDHPTPGHPTAAAPGIPHANITDIALTVIPITMVTIAFSVVLIAAFLFRRRICISKKKKKNKATKKEDM